MCSVIKHRGCMIAWLSLSYVLAKDGAYTESDITPCAEVSLATRDYLRSCIAQ